MFWGGAGEVGSETLCTRYRATHLVFAKWNTNLHPFIALIEPLLKNIGRSAPEEVLGFADDTPHFISRTGEISVSFKEVTHPRLAMP
ncbi:MAG: hypothetical protein GFH27_549289n260 [Chloroflexi bacterium AL-W]|nr:hypothetical protein [Chloroflexi bacterium AL-N1]NOK66992.1 hypothetical protein [Chloroflexi bacterium AL-N10]NOK74716.1 hypothetical protein [Chloroflexi bacterium AL-N5]NOK81594.1 hypothetical protein [Chloroflexi bacterium AL-W]NOK89064.1 hypothetical protein [Chloroflexi bacterium AL-N15]